MRIVRKVIVASLAALTLAVPAACGKEQPTPSDTPTAAPSATESPTVTPTPPVTASPTPGPTQSTPGTTVLSARVAYKWGWPNDPPTAGKVSHRQTVPPVPQLVRIGVGAHPRDGSNPPFNRMSFTFTVGFPSYEFEFTDRLIGDGSGLPIPLEGLGVLRVVFHQAMAHTVDGTRSSIVAQPPAHLGLNRMLSYASAGDYEGYVTYGIGITYEHPQSNPQFGVRAYEVTMVNRSGQGLYVVAIDVES